MRRPETNNADEWAVFLSEYSDAIGYLAVQIAEAIDVAEGRGCERRIEKMGWREINAFHEELRRGQSVYEDAGGFFLRRVRKLFGISSNATVVTYQDAARALIREHEDRTDDRRPDRTSPREVSGVSRWR